MINHISLLQNIGTFDSDCPGETLRLERTTFVYAENGRGKTTLSAILRSLASGDPQPILERKRLGSTHPPRIILKRHEKPSSLIFKNNAWTNTLPELKIFDDTFIDENVYSGLSVDPQHRRNLHELIIGDRGVTLNDKLHELVSRIEQHNNELDEKKKAIPQEFLFGFSVGEFCDLKALSNIDHEIEKASVELSASRNKEEIQSRPLFEPLELPEFDVETIKKILLTGLPDMTQCAEIRVQAHVQALGDDGESWVEKGFNSDLAKIEKKCPFCGQNLDNLSLLNHYSVYFSESYAQLKQSAADMIADINSIHADNAPVSFERAVGITNAASQFWNRFVDVRQINVDTTSIVNDWRKARETVVALLETKQSAPLEELKLDEGTLKILNTYNSHRNVIREIDQHLDSSNRKILNLKEQMEKTNEEKISNTIRTLQATKTRHSAEIAPLCQDYINEKDAKTHTESERDQTRMELDEYRNTVFPRIESRVNNYLQEFNAGFRIGSLKPRGTGRGTGSICDYSVVINNSSINVGSKSPSNGDHKPSFRNSLSAGDRNTLALAFFFSSLDDASNLSNSIIVIDDPMASLDEHRANATVRKVRELIEQAKQVIVLSHNKRFLCNVWSYLRPHECCSLEIAQSQKTSTIQSWNINQAAITEYDEQHKRLKEFAKNQTGTTITIVRDIRPHLEGYLRVACPEDFQPGENLERFLKKCKEKLGEQDEILNDREIRELTAIKEYSNPYHHGPNPARLTEDISATELAGFVNRTLKFTNPFRSFLPD